MSPQNFSDSRRNNRCKDQGNYIFRRFCHPFTNRHCRLRSDSRLNLHSDLEFHFFGCHVKNDIRRNACDQSFPLYPESATAQIIENTTNPVFGIFTS